ncbi:unnamed protein product [Calicophoron daubneyi]|uniref:Uncharacterized protein n=1 Tax=Calicophoron daubneyi TaxID=300641 RepID=A0AAV2TD68_CALDB
MATKSDLCQLQWNPVDVSSGPALRDHAGTIVGDYLYVHGGQNLAGTSNSVPLNGFYRIQISPAVGQWMDLTTADSPTLSQHACVSFNEQYLIFIGGWTGQVRTPSIHTFDTLSQSWLPPATSPPLLTGFPDGAGLSAHSAVPMKSDGSFSATFIVGREGSLRIQRKAGNVYLLYGKFSTKKGAQYTYREANPGIVVSSRSYHTSSVLSPTSVMDIGGRSSNPIEVISWARSSTNFGSDLPGPLQCPPTQCDLVSRLLQEMRMSKVSMRKSFVNKEICLRGHAAIPGDEGVFVTAGEGFNALKHGPLEDAYVVDFSKGRIKEGLQYVGRLHNPRAYAVYGVHATDATAWMHGGLGPGGRVCKTLLQLGDLQAEDE